jgi:hypothetical protein
MNRINKEAGTTITVYHTFHDEARATNACEHSQLQQQLRVCMCVCVCIAGGRAPHARLALLGPLRGHAAVLRLGQAGHESAAWPHGLVVAEAPGMSDAGCGL